MNFLSLILFFLIISAKAEEYTGPQTPGIEKFSCGEYEVKGKLKKIEMKKNQDSLFYLIPYAETSREYKIKLYGDLERFSNGDYLLVRGHSWREWHNSVPELHIFQNPKRTTELESLKNTVRLIKSSSCK